MSSIYNNIVGYLNYQKRDLKAEEEKLVQKLFEQNVSNLEKVGLQHFIVLSNRLSYIPVRNPLPKKVAEPFRQMFEEFEKNSPLLPKELIELYGRVKENVRSKMVDYLSEGIVELNLKIEKVTCLLRGDEKDPEGLAIKDFIQGVVAKTLRVQGMLQELFDQLATEKEFTKLRGRLEEANIYPRREPSSQDP